MGKATGIKGLLDRLSKPNTPTEVRSVKSQIRQKVLDNPRLTGDTEKDALAEINAMANKRIEEMKSASSSTKTALPSAEANKRSKAYKAQKEAEITQKQGSIATRTPVTQTSIREATSANAIQKYIRDIGEMKDGLIKTALLKMARAKLKALRSKQAGDAQKMENRISSANRDRTKNKKENVSLAPGMNFSKGGMSKKRMAYKDGGYVNCGASVPGTQKNKK